MRIIIPSQVEIQDAEYAVVDIDGNTSFFSELKDAKAGGFEQSLDKISCYILGKGDVGRMFDVPDSGKVLSCTFSLRADVVHILKREKRIEIDFSSREDFESRLKQCFKEHPEHGVLMDADGELHELTEGQPIPDVDGALSITITPYLMLDMSFFDYTEDYVEGIIVLNISSSKPVVINAYTSATMHKVNIQGKEEAKNSPPKTGFERFCESATFDR